MWPVAVVCKFQRNKRTTGLAPARISTTDHLFGLPGTAITTRSIISNRPIVCDCISARGCGIFNTHQTTPLPSKSPHLHILPTAYYISITTTFSTLQTLHKIRQTPTKNHNKTLKTLSYLTLKLHPIFIFQPI